MPPGGGTHTHARIRQAASARPRTLVTLALDENHPSTGAQFGPTALLHPWKATVARRLSRSMQLDTPRRPPNSPESLLHPPRHRRRWRSTNLLERSLGEVKRRTKVMGRFPGEESCLTLVWAVLDLLITHETNGIRFTELDRQRLNRVRYHEPDHAIPEEVTAA